MFAGLLIWVAQGFAQPGLGAYRFDLEGGLGAAVGTPSAQGSGGPSAVGFGLGALIAHGERWGFEVGAREGLANNDFRSVGALFFGARWGFAGTAFARLGVAHNHEVPGEVLKADPLLATIGSAPGIRHRTGAELGLGWRLPLEDAILKDRPGLSVGASLSVFPDELGPSVYGFLDLCALVGVGRRRPGASE